MRGLAYILVIISGPEQRHRLIWAQKPEAKLFIRINGQQHSSGVEAGNEAPAAWAQICSSSSVQGHWLLYQAGRSPSSTQVHPLKRLPTSGPLPALMPQELWAESANSAGAAAFKQLQCANASRRI